MAKIDKSSLTKEEWHRIRNQRRKAKSLNQQATNKSVVAGIPKEDIQFIPEENRDTGIAFVLGNGTSRAGLSLPQMHQHGKLYACNAVYREYAPDHLVAVDTKMVLEINKFGYQLKNSVWTNYNKLYEKFKGFNYFEPRLGWSSGPTALHLASQHNYHTIYILGFDYVGLHEKVNNIYAGTANYKKQNDRATYYGNWLRQTGIVIQKNPEKRYIRVVGDSGYLEFIPEQLEKFSNLTHISKQEFKEKFSLS
jgi:hypothetical protein